MAIKLSPFSDNIIFFDSEFSTNEPNLGELLSFGMVKGTGEELYIELDFHGETSDFVKKNVLPHLMGEKVSKAVAALRIKKFVGSDKPFLVTFVNQFDYVYLCKIIPYIELPFDSIPIDFASILFSLNIDPHEFRGERRENLIRNLGIDPIDFKPHHALFDARLLKEVYLKILET